jgi:hypothetical protein
MLSRKKKVQKRFPPFSQFKGFIAEKHIPLQEIADLLGHSVTTISQKNNGWTDYTMSEVDTKLLYVCITRAMNTLDIYHVDDLTELLK